MDIKDIAGLSKPLVRLIDVVSAGVGAVSQPYLIRRSADAQAYEIRVIAAAIAETSEQNNLPILYKGESLEIWKKPDDGTFILEPIELDNQIAKRIDYTERRRQKNIEAITQVAARELAHETQVPDDRPDEDWITRFFNSAQDISSEEMQHLWGQILTGEIKKPGTYSLRAIDSIRNLTKIEAEVFQRVGKLALKNSGVWFIVVNDKEWLAQHRHIHASDHFLLGELGILYPSDISLTFLHNPQQPEKPLTSEEYALHIEFSQIKTDVHLSIWKFTGVGQELLSLIPKPLDEEYLEYIGHHFIKLGAQAQICKIIERSGSGQIHMEIIKKIKRSSTEPETAMQNEISNA